MIYILSDGAYSDYGVHDVVQRDEPVTPEESALIKAAYTESCSYPYPSYYDMLVTRFGFKAVEFAEIHEGVKS